MDIKFNIPARKEITGLRFAFDEEFSSQLRVIMHHLEITMSEAVEMLAKASAPIFLEQNKIEEGQIQKTIVAIDETTNRKCHNKDCVTRPNYHLVREMIKYNNNYFCSHLCVDKHKENIKLKIEEEITNKCGLCFRKLGQYNTAKERINGKKVCDNCYETSTRNSEKTQEIPPDLPLFDKSKKVKCDYLDCPYKKEVLNPEFMVYKNIDGVQLEFCCDECYNNYKLGDE